MAAVHVASWRAGFRKLIDAGTLPDADLTQRIAFWHTCLALDPDKASALVAETVQGITGVFLIRWRPEDRVLAEQGFAQINVLYVAPWAWRSGSGRALVEAGNELLRARGRIGWVLWTLAEHAGTRAFYAAQGFTPDGSERQDDGGARLVRLRAIVNESPNLDIPRHHGLQ